MNQKWIGLLLGFSLPITVGAQTVPAIQVNHSLQPVRAVAPRHRQTVVKPVLAEDTLKLTIQQQQAVNLSNQWINTADAPNLGEGGTVKFNFGSGLATIICAPLYVCDVSLQAGEVVTQVDVGDALRWKVTPATSGQGHQTVTHLLVKPTDLGLSTNMLIHTDRRTYNMLLLSKKESWMPNVAFSYPEEAEIQWAAYRERQQQAEKEPMKLNISTDPDSGINFNYQVSGKNYTWKPLRVYADAAKTYIQFPAQVKNTKLPALLILGDGKQLQLVNYRIQGDRFVVDQVINRAALILGVGKHQERIEIIQEGQE